ncbi:hypothetical protein DPMN_159991 [Dreissena polymorpha]|uniref:Uncharacterized protein n=1 Tax=Dreissena polymorpha TaxID=45954 RepID=A0A9D4ELI3_DREPO|nr:hypothetical protein DPMN_159991 [Dreissena polymorpha]
MLLRSSSVHQTEQSISVSSGSHTLSPTLGRDFTLHEQPNLSRSGVGKPSPVLDQGKLDLLRGPDLK